MRRANATAARLPACTARSPQHAQRSSSERNPTESSTPLGFVLAPPKALTAYCSDCASAWVCQRNQPKRTCSVSAARHSTQR